MILVSRQSFGVSRYCAREHTEVALGENASGPVLRVRIRFDQWFKEKRLEADAFIDSGADTTLISSRWVTEQGGVKRRARPKSSVLDPERADHYLLEEEAFVEIGGIELSLGSGLGILPAPALPGYEDILLGRDFLSRHRLLFVLDAGEATFSILKPSDEDNRLRRNQILRALDKSATPGPPEGDAEQPAVARPAAR